jgi:hypothetical protein
MFTSAGGYCGCISQWGGVHTPFGYIFPDVLQGKWFLLTESVEEISLNGMNQFFDNTLGTDLKQGYVDNPFNPSSAGITGVWDNELKRAILTKRGGTEEYTYSYNPVSKAWVSEHSYLPHAYIGRDNEVFAFVNTTEANLYQHNRGRYGEFYGVLNPFYIEFILNEGPALEKSFDNINIHSVAYDEVAGFEHLETFKHIVTLNDYQNSGLINIDTTNQFNPTLAADTILGRWKKNHFQVALPRDRQSNLDTDPLQWARASRMKSKYLLVQLTYPNNALENKKLGTDKVSKDNVDKAFDMYRNKDFKLKQEYYRDYGGQFAPSEKRRLAIDALRNPQNADMERIRNWDALEKRDYDDWFHNVKMRQLSSDPNQYYHGTDKVTPPSLNPIAASTTMAGINYPMNIAPQGYDQNPYRMNGVRTLVSDSPSAPIDHTGGYKVGNELPVATEPVKSYAYGTSAIKKYEKGTDGVNSERQSTFESLLSRVSEERGLSPESIRGVLDKIAYHESANTMDPKIKQYGGGPGRGLFQFEPGSLKVAYQRANNYFKKRGENSPFMVDESYDATNLPADEQRALALIDMLERPNFNINEAAKSNEGLVNEWGRGWQTKSDPKKMKVFSKHAERWDRDASKRKIEAERKAELNRLQDEGFQKSIKPQLDTLNIADSTEQYQPRPKQYAFGTNNTQGDVGYQIVQQEAGDGIAGTLTDISSVGKIGQGAGQLAGKLTGIPGADIVGGAIGQGIGMTAGLFKNINEDYNRRQYNARARQDQLAKGRFRMDDSEGYQAVQAAEGMSMVSGTPLQSIQNITGFGKVDKLDDSNSKWVEVQAGEGLTNDNGDLINSEPFKAKNLTQYEDGTYGLKKDLKGLMGANTARKYAIKGKKHGEYGVEKYQDGTMAISGGELMRLPFGTGIVKHTDLEKYAKADEYKRRAMLSKYPADDENYPTLQQAEKGMSKVKKYAVGTPDVNDDFYGIPFASKSKWSNRNLYKDTPLGMIQDDLSPGFGVKRYDYGEGVKRYDPQFKLNTDKTVPMVGASMSPMTPANKMDIYRSNAGEYDLEGLSPDGGNYGMVGPQRTYDYSHKIYPDMKDVSDTDEMIKADNRFDRDVKRTVMKDKTDKAIESIRNKYKNKSKGESMLNPASFYNLAQGTFGKVGQDAPYIMSDPLYKFEDLTAPQRAEALRQQALQNKQIGEARLSRGGALGAMSQASARRMALENKLGLDSARRFDALKLAEQQARQQTNQFNIGQYEKAREKYQQDLGAQERMQATGFGQMADQRDINRQKESMMSKDYNTMASQLAKLNVQRMRMGLPEKTMEEMIDDYGLQFEFDVKSKKKYSKKNDAKLDSSPATTSSYSPMNDIGISPNYRYKPNKKSYGTGINKYRLR